MKKLTMMFLAMLCTPLLAQEPAPADAKPEMKLAPHQQAFLNLPEEARTQFYKQLGEATRMFRDKRIFESLDHLNQAQAIFPDSPEVQNLYGSCYVEIRDFDKALAKFTRAAELANGDASIEFNVGEVYFCTKEWQKCLDTLKDVLTKLQVDNKNLALARLVEFKIMLCQLKLGQEAEAAKLATKYDEMDDSPIYYYSNAAMDYFKGDNMKAEMWLARGNKVHDDPGVTAPWQDTLVEYGYIKSFYGDDLQSEE